MRVDDVLKEHGVGGGLKEKDFQNKLVLIGSKNEGVGSYPTALFLGDSDYIYDHYIPSGDNYGYIQKRAKDMKLSLIEQGNINIKTTTSYLLETSEYIFLNENGSIRPINKSNLQEDTSLSNIRAMNISYGGAYDNKDYIVIQGKKRINYVDNQYLCKFSKDSLELIDELILSINYSQGDRAFPVIIDDKIFLFRYNKVDIYTLDLEIINSSTIDYGDVNDEMSAIMQVLFAKDGNIFIYGRRTEYPYYNYIWSINLATMKANNISPAHNNSAMIFNNERGIYMFPGTGTLVYSYDEELNKYEKYPLPVAYNINANPTMRNVECTEHEVAVKDNYGTVSLYKIF